MALRVDVVYKFIIEAHVASSSNICMCAHKIPFALFQTPLK